MFPKIHHKGSRYCMIMLYTGKIYLVIMQSLMSALMCQLLATRHPLFTFKRKKKKYDQTRYQNLDLWQLVQVLYQLNYPDCCISPHIFLFTKVPCGNLTSKFLLISLQTVTRNRMMQVQTLDRTWDLTLQGTVLYQLNYSGCCILSKILAPVTLDIVAL